MKTFYILGASGFMGGRFAQYLQQQGHTVITDRVDITDLPALQKAFAATKPDVVVNFAGVRAYPNIDWCEEHKLETVAVNVGGPINVAHAAITAGAYAIQIASGCIYSGGEDQPFTEEDEPNFTGSFYSRMRIAMQQALAELPVLQVRIRMPLSGQPHPRNLLDKIIGYPKVISVPNSVTIVEDMFVALEQLAQSQPTGILNLVNPGAVKHEQLLEAYKAIVKPDHQYEVISVADLYQSLTVAKRSNCILSTAKAESLGVALPPLDEARITQLMETYKQHLV